MKRITENKSLWKAIRLRFFTICAAFSVMWIITGSPVTSVGLTAAQQSVSFGVHYLFEENERKSLEVKETKVMPKEYENHLPEDFL